MMLNKIVFVSLVRLQGERENKYLRGMIISPSDENHLSRKFVIVFKCSGTNSAQLTGQILCSCVIDEKSKLVFSFYLVLNSISRRSFFSDVTRDVRRSRFCFVRQKLDSSIADFLFFTQVNNFVTLRLLFLDTNASVSAIYFIHITCQTWVFCFNSDKFKEIFYVIEILFSLLRFCTKEKKIYLKLKRKKENDRRTTWKRLWKAAARRENDYEAGR